ncbi:guanine nucleotide exchange factor mss4 [Plakobranchus ocellatus]|uniref:Guanine nucleotide exchange factor mss4 n=1 Tax=Plakobranchus ocellatus TaxID=259542 RepID=A0AAV4BM69_9GAST|nr:guanine nucleotide exchange factor mss4 [Plakobranchus ocellatus]
MAEAKVSKVDSTVSTVKLEEISDDEGQNKTRIFCQRCPSLVLSSKQAKLIKKEFFLPNMFQKNDHAPLEGVTLNDFWLVTNMMTFDNVGFSKAVDNIMYLICADCEMGPIGWHSVDNKKAYYIAVDRVKHG